MGARLNVELMEGYVDPHTRSKEGERRRHHQQQPTPPLFSSHICFGFDATVGSSGGAQPWEFVATVQGLPGGRRQYSAALEVTGAPEGGGGPFAGTAALAYFELST